MYGGAIFKHLEKDKFLVTNAGDGKDIDHVVVKLTLKDLKEVLSAYGVDTKRKKKQELLDDFIKVSKNMTVDPKPVPPKKSPKKSPKKQSVKFEPMEEMMMDTTPKPKNVQIKKPKPDDVERVKALEKAASPARLSQLLPIRSERENDLLEFEDDELKEIIQDQEIKFKGGDKRDMVDAILKHEGIKKGSILPKDKYDDLETMHNILNLKVKSGERGLDVMYRALNKFKEDLNKMMKNPDRDTSAEFFQDQKINQYKEKIKDAEDLFLKDGFNRKTKAAAKTNAAAKAEKIGGRIKRKKGGSISAKDLKGLHASSYKEQPDKEVNGWVLDEDISKPTARVYFNASKNQAIVVHRGTEATAKDWANNLAFVAGVSPLTQRYKDSKEVQEKAEAKYSDVLTTGHSQGSIYTKLAKNKKGIIDVNPASFIQSTEGTTVRAKNDPVSALRGIANMFSSKGKENITTSAKANPLAAHSIDILDELGDKELGTGLTKYLKGLKKGSGRFEDFFKKTLPRALIKQGIPLAMSLGASSLGSIGGPITGLVAGEVGAQAGQLLADDISKKAGLGLTRRLRSLGR